MEFFTTVHYIEQYLKPQDSVDLVQGNAMDLSRYEDKIFDIVLLFGPLYHLHKEADRQKCIAEAKRVCKDGGIQIEKEVASDGVSELLEDKINSLDEESFKQYLRYHFYVCEKPEMLGRSNHLLFIGR